MISSTALWNWWGLRNSQEFGNNNSTALYGWRQYGDYGIVSTATTGGSSTSYDCYPTYYAFKLLSKFARGGDSIVSVSSDNTLLSAGPGSTLSLKGYAFAPATQEGSIDATLDCGTLAVVSGAIAKHSPEAVRLSTPVTLIGVRGTEFVLRAGCRE